MTVPLTTVISIPQSAYGGLSLAIRVQECQEGT
jgi:hypothetical protein